MNERKSGTPDKLTGEEIGGHSGQSEVLNKRCDNMNSEFEILKRRDEVKSKQIETLKLQLVQKDLQINSIRKRINDVENEIKSIKDENDGRMKTLTENIERKITERRENDELDIARVIQYVDKKIAAVKLLIQSNILADIRSVKSQLQSVQALVGLEQVDSSFVWLIDDDINKTSYSWTTRQSEYFTGEVHPYKYRLRSENYEIIGTARAALLIQLLIHAGPNDEQLAWPFKARVVITVSDRHRREACRSISLQCWIERPPNNECRGSGAFHFLHPELRGAGLNLSRGVRVSCVIVPGAG